MNLSSKWHLNTLILILFTLLSCKKIPKSTSEVIPFKIPDYVSNELISTSGGTINYDNYVAVISSQLANSINRNNTEEIKAYAKISSNGTAVNAGPLILNDKTVYPSTDNLYFYQYTKPETIALYGSNIEVSISESAAARPLQKVIMVVPKDIFPTTVTVPLATVDRSVDYVLNWNADPTNQFGKVQILISYYKGISQLNASNMPTDVQQLLYVVPDNGTYTIPKNDLGRFPNGSYIGISISRAWVDNTTNSIAYVSVVEAHTIPLLVIESSTPLRTNFYRYWSATQTDHFYSTTYESHYGYIYEKVECKVFASLVSGTVPIYVYYRSGADHYYTKTYGNYPTYTYESIACYIYPTAQPSLGTIPLYGYWNGSNIDHFSTL